MTNRCALVAAVLSITLAACSKSASHTTASAAASSPAPAGNACDRKLLTAADVTDLLGAPVTETKTIPGDAQSCEFGTAGYNSVTVTIRPGLGDVTVQTWVDGKMPVSAAPMSGVGDRAAWVAELSEVVATKANLLCDIQVSGGSKRSATQQAAIGALCNKVFAAG
jgi:hypothetical protein